MPKPHVVILGGGFGGLSAAKGLRHEDVEVTLVDRRNFHLFQPLLYQVATGGLSPADIAAPLRGILKRQANARVVQDEVIDIDTAKREVVLRSTRVNYDYLVVATGVRHHYFGHDEWESRAPGLKTIEDATAIRSKLLHAFELSEKTGDPVERQRLLTFVIIGGGPTGVELAGALGELANHTLAHEFRAFDPSSAKILLLEGADRILISYPESLSQRAVASLESLGVEVRTKTLVTEVLHERLILNINGKTSDLNAGCILWAAGVRASSLGKILAEKTGAELDGAGRVKVETDLSIQGNPSVFVIGDLASVQKDGQDGPGSEVLPGTAPVATQQGRYVAKVVSGRCRNQACPRFVYLDKGSLAVIGRARAVARLGRLNFHGYPAWLLWLFVHLLYLVKFESRLIVFIQWAWNYFTRNRRARLITGATSPVTSGDESEPTRSTLR